MTKHTIRIGGGTAKVVYDDTLVPLLTALGKVTVTRASHVEPHPMGGWVADMAPSGGPALFANGEWWGLTPPYRHAAASLVGFPTRAEALAAEREWLRVNKGL